MIPAEPTIEVSVCHGRIVMAMPDGLRYCAGCGVMRSGIDAVRYVRADVVELAVDEARRAGFADSGVHERLARLKKEAGGD